MNRLLFPCVCSLLLSSGGLSACAYSTELDHEFGDAAAGKRNGTGTAGTVQTGGSSGSGGNAGAGLTSGIFGSRGGASGRAGETAVCEPSNPNLCDWARVEGCCSRWACKRANQQDVFNTYPIESCQDLVTCVQAHPGCSNPQDPLCFQNESLTAPCLQEGYQASHTDPDGPFAWTAGLVACVCGYGENP